MDKPTTEKELKIYTKENPIIHYKLIVFCQKMIKLSMEL